MWHGFLEEISFWVKFMKSGVFYSYMSSILRWWSWYLCVQKCNKILNKTIYFLLFFINCLMRLQQVSAIFITEKRCRQSAKKIQNLQIFVARCKHNCLRFMFAILIYHLFTWLPPYPEQFSDWSDSLELSIYTSYWIEKLSHMPLWWLRLAAVWDNICPHSKRRFRKCKLKGTVLQQFFGEFSWAELTNLTILFVDTLASWSLVPFADRWTRLHTLHLLLLWLL